MIDIELAPAPDSAFEAALQAAMDNKTKPVGALGRLEDLALQLARIQRSLTPTARRARLQIFAADHGMAAHGVSAFPQAVTGQMVSNFLAGGAAANVIAARLGVTVEVIDAGVAGEPIEHPALRQHRIGPGTANAIRGSAMTAEQRDLALRDGQALGAEGDDEVACFGEMGIGNTSAASLLYAKVLGLELEPLCGRGTGLDDAALARKRALLTEAAARTSPTLTAPQALAEYGGFEIAMMTGAMLGAASAGKLVLVDGFIAGSAACCALAMAPALRAHLCFAHCSAEAGHRIVLDTLGVQPLLSLDMRLGEGTGALLAWPFVQAAAGVLSDMASFDSAGVSQSDA
ncbi:MAG: nicotinate-nucleotide--dimethylbenzimidazole phosphoribosyltransferase [Pseudomonadota bacterium]